MKLIPNSKEIGLYATLAFVAASFVGYCWQPTIRFAERYQYGLRKEGKNLWGDVVRHNTFRVDCENPYATSSGLNYVDKFASLIDFDRDGLVDKIVIGTSAASGEPGPALIGYEDLYPNQPEFEKYRTFLEEKGVLKGRKIAGK